MNTPAALAPLRGPVFRGLWLAWLAANMTMWMNDVAASWLMTSLTTSPVMVALVTTASTLPVFVLGLPSGAIADIVDRRRYFAATQLWVSVNALVLSALALAGALTAELLLLLTFTNGVGLALRWPAFSAIVAQVVPREELPQALALNGVSMNLSRVIGPMVAGALITAVSPAAVFALNAVLSAGAFVLVLRWRSTPRTSALPGERFVGAMRAGLNFALQSPRLKTVLLRVMLFFFQSAGLTALLPLVAKGLHGGGPGTFTVMLACMGLGAIAAAMLFPRWRRQHDPDTFVRVGTVVHALVAALVILWPEIWVALPAMFVIGMAWISVANSLSVSAQTILPDWVRARGMSMYQMSLMGAAAAGSLTWGQVASVVGVPMAVLAASGFGLVATVLARRFVVSGGEQLDFSPVTPPVLPHTAIEVGPEEGPVMVTVEYLIDPQRAEEFSRIMERTRRARLRQGALSWGLFRDTGQPGRIVEYFVDENWLEHQRRLERFTAFDAELREQRLALHLGPEPPVTRRYVGEAMRERPDAPV
jgi:MFS family permease